MDVDYLKKNVGETLATGLAAVVMNNPPDSVDFLAKWLLNYVENVKKQEAEAGLLAKQVKQDEEDAMKALAEYEAKLQLKQEKKATELRKHQSLEEYLSTVRDTEGLLEKFIELLQTATDAAGIYIGHYQDESLQYIAATKGQEFMLGKKLEKGAEDDDGEKQTPVTFSLFEPDEEREEEPEDDDDLSTDAKARLPVGPQVKSVMVPNVLMGPQASKVNFFRLQQMGCYYAVKINYEATLSNDVLENAAVKEDELEEEARKAARDKADEEDADGEGDEGDEETKEEQSEVDKAASAKATAEAKAEAHEQALVSALKLEEVTYALCIDTLGQNRRLTPKQVAFINKFSLKLMAALERIDRAFFKDERKRRRELKKFSMTWGDRRADQEEDTEELANKLQKRDSPQTTEDIRFLSRQQIIAGNSLLKKMLLEHAKFEVLKGPIKVCQAFLCLLGWKMADIQTWRKVRSCFTEDLLTKVRAYNPRDLEAKKEPEASSEALQSVLDEVNLEDIKDNNQVLAELYGYVQDALALTAKAEEEAREAAEQKRLEEEEAERERLEEEARLAAEEEERQRQEENSDSAPVENDDTES